MNKKLNTVLFLLGATLFNVLTTLISLFGLLILFGIYFAPNMADEGRSWATIIIFLSSLAISFFAYRGVMKLILLKVDVEKYFDPIFVRRNMRKLSD